MTRQWCAGLQLRFVYKYLWADANLSLQIRCFFFLAFALSACGDHWQWLGACQGLHSATKIFFVNDGYNGSHWELISGWHCWWRSASMHFPSRGRKAEAWRDDARTCACCHLTDIAMLFTHQGPWFFQELTRGNAIWERKQWQNVACWRCHIQLASQPWIRKLIQSFSVFLIAVCFPL